jgi:hypothetical protein
MGSVPEQVVEEFTQTHMHTTEHGKKLSSYLVGRARYITYFTLERGQREMTVCLMPLVL